MQVIVGLLLVVLGVTLFFNTPAPWQYFGSFAVGFGVVHALFGLIDPLY